MALGGPVPLSGSPRQHGSEAYKHVSKAEYEELVEMCSDKSLTFPLEAKTWSRQVLQNFIDSGGALRPEVCSIPDQRFLENVDMKEEDINEALTKAAAWLITADAVLVGSGAGMGVDSGLSTFRGKNSGVWPGLEQLGLAYEEVCEPHWFTDDPRLAWGFWHFCHVAYQKTQPHEGYKLVRDWASSAPLGAFSFTSNIDGHWEASGWAPERLVEVHGAVRRLQCSGPCCAETWEATSDLGLSENVNTHCADGQLPVCPRCGKVARPAVQMFGDDKGFSRELRNKRAAAYDAWLKDLATRPDGLRTRLVCIELGCGLTVPTVRRELESVVQRFPGARLIRVNPEQVGMDKKLAAKGASLPMAAGEAIRRLSEAMQRWWGGPANDRGVQSFTCVVWDAEGGGAEVEVPVGATVEQLLRLLRRQQGVDLQLGPSREVVVTAYHLLMAGYEASVGFHEPVPASMMSDIGKQKAAVIVVNGIRFLSGRSAALERRVAWAHAVLDDLIAAFSAEEFQVKAAAAKDRKGLNSLLKITHAKVMPLHGLEMPSGVNIMAARIGLAYRGSREVADKVEKSLELSHLKKRDTQAQLQQQPEQKQPVQNQTVQNQPQQEQLQQKQPQVAQQQEMQPEQKQPVQNQTVQNKMVQNQLQQEQPQQKQPQVAQPQEMQPEQKQPVQNQTVQNQLQQEQPQQTHPQEKQPQEMQMEEPQQPQQQEVQREEDRLQGQPQSQLQGSDVELPAQIEPTPKLQPESELQPERPALGQKPQPSLQLDSQLLQQSNMPMAKLQQLEKGESHIDGHSGSRSRTSSASTVSLALSVSVSRSCGSERSSAEPWSELSSSDEEESTTANVTPQQTVEPASSEPPLPKCMSLSDAARSDTDVDPLTEPTVCKGPASQADKSQVPAWLVTMAEAMTHPVASTQAPSFSMTKTTSKEELTISKATSSTSSMKAVSAPQCATRKEFKVMVSPGDDSWEGRVLVSIPEDAAVADVKAAIATLVGRPDIKRYSKLAAPSRGKGGPTILKDTERFGNRKEVRLLDADGLQWPPKPAKVKVKCADSVEEFILSVRTGAAMAEVQQLLARQLHLAKLPASARLGRRLADGVTFVAFADDEPLGTRRTLLIEGLYECSEPTAKNRGPVPAPEPLRYPHRGMFVEDLV